MVGQNRVTGIDFLREDLLKQGVDLTPFESQPTQDCQEQKPDSVKDEVIKSIVTPKAKAQLEGGQLIAPSLGKDEQQKFAQLYTQVSQLVSDAKFVVVSRMCSPSA